MVGYTNFVKPKRMGGLDNRKRLRKLEEQYQKEPTDLAAEADSDGSEDLGASGNQFSGYGALHLVVKVPPRLHQDENKDKNWKDIVVEIQVGTVLMHAWSEVEHDITYKKRGGEPTEDMERVLDIINGLVLAGEVALRGFKSPAIPGHPTNLPGTLVESPGELRRCLCQYFTINNLRAPRSWEGLEDFFQLLTDTGHNRYDTVRNLTESARLMPRDLPESNHLSILPTLKRLLFGHSDTTSFQRFTPILFFPSLFRFDGRLPMRLDGMQWYKVSPISFGLINVNGYHEITGAETQLPAHKKISLEDDCLDKGILVLAYKYPREAPVKIGTVIVPNIGRAWAGETGLATWIEIGYGLNWQFHVMEADKQESSVGSWLIQAGTDTIRFSGRAKVCLRSRSRRRTEIIGEDEITKIE